MYKPLLKFCPVQIFPMILSSSVGIATHVLYLEMSIEQHPQNCSCRCVVSADQSYVWEPEILRRQKKGSTLWTLWTLWGCGAGWVDSGALSSTSLGASAPGHIVTPRWTSESTEIHDLPNWRISAHCSALEPSRISSHNRQQ